MTTRIMVFLALLSYASSAWAARPATHITGALLTVGGSTPKNVTLSVVPNATFTVNDTVLGAASKFVVGMVPQTFNVTDASNVSIYLVPNTGSGNTPDATSYTATIRSSVGAFTQTWSVPTTSSDIRVADIIVPSAVSPSYAYLPITGGTLTDKLTLAGNTAVRFVPTTEPATANKGDVYYDSETDALKYSNGSQWILIGSGTGGGGGGGSNDDSGGVVLAESNPGVTVSNTTDETTIFSVSIPGGTLGTNYKARVTLASLYRSLAAQTATIKLTYGATTLYTGSLDLVPEETSDKYAICQVELMGDGTASAQFGTSRIFLQDRVDSYNGSFTSTETSSATKTFAITWQWGTANVSNTITSKHAVVESLGAASSGIGSIGTVVHDATLNGDGNSLSPLGVLTGNLVHNSLSGLTTGNPHTQYLLSSALAGNLEPYALKTTVNTSLSAYLPTTTFNSTMTNYVSNATLSSTLAGYMQAGGGNLSGNLSGAGYQFDDLRVDNVTSDPASPTVGQMWFNTGDELFKVYNGHTAVNFLARANHTGTQTVSTISDIGTYYLPKTGGTVTGNTTVTGTTVLNGNVSVPAGNVSIAGGNLSLGYGQLGQFVIESFNADPTPGHSGRIIWRENLKQLRQDDGTRFTALAVGGGSVQAVSPIAGNGLSGAPLTITTSAIIHSQLGNLTVGDPHSQYCLKSTINSTLTSYATLDTLGAYLPITTANTSFSSCVTTSTFQSVISTYATTAALEAGYLPLTGGSLSGNLSLGENQIKAFRVENVTSNPTAGNAGRLVYNSLLGKLQIDNGAEVTDLAASGTIMASINDEPAGVVNVFNFRGFSSEINGLTLNVSPSVLSPLSISGNDIKINYNTAQLEVADGNLSIKAGSIGNTELDGNIAFSELADVSQAGKILGRSSAGAGSIEEITCTTAAMTLLDDPDTATMRATLAVPSTSTQIVAGTYLTGGGNLSGNVDLGVSVGSAANTLCAGDDGRLPTSDEKAALAGTGTPSGSNKYVTADSLSGYQPVDAQLSALASLAGGANMCPYFTDAGSMSMATVTTFARSILDDEDASTVRATIGAASRDSTVTAGSGIVVGGGNLGGNLTIGLSGKDENGANVTSGKVWVADGSGSGAWAAQSGGSGNVLSGFGAYSGLVVEYASTSTVTLTASSLTMSDGTNTKDFSGISCNINLAASGNINQLDSGSESTSTWYAVWAAGKADGTTGGLLSTSATTPILPSGYTFKRRCGWVRNLSDGNLRESLQVGTKVYSVWSSGCQVIENGQARSWTAVDCSAWLPPTAYSAEILFWSNAGGVKVQFQPRTSWAGSCWSSQPPTAYYQAMGWVPCYGQNIVYLTDANQINVCVHGWEDNI